MDNPRLTFSLNLNPIVSSPLKLILYNSYDVHPSNSVISGIIKFGVKESEVDIIELNTIVRFILQDRTYCNIIIFNNILNVCQFLIIKKILLE
ncbi:MAG: hypothetical protein QW757_05495 [Candidatus Woesearchaeota archaeon]